MQLIDFDLTAYAEIYALQKRLVQQRLQGEIPDTLLVGEHPPVITLGRGTKPDNILNPQVPIVEIERGGDITYHGPGQLIAYPILKLPDGRRDLHRYLRDLEEAVILALHEFGIEGRRNESYTGVWVDDSIQGLKKLCSIGVAVKQWVTYHGLALNVSTDLSAFAQINPCGLESQVMTSISALQQATGQEPVTMEAVKPVLTTCLQSLFCD